MSRNGRWCQALDDAIFQVLGSRWVGYVTCLDGESCCLLFVERVICYSLLFLVFVFVKRRDKCDWIVTFFLSPSFDACTQSKPPRVLVPFGKQIIGTPGRETLWHFQLRYLKSSDFLMNRLPDLFDIFDPFDKELYILTYN